MGLFAFGSGVLVGLLPNGQPRKFGTLQEAQVSFDPTIKELHGEFQLPVDVARGTAKVGGTAKAATIRGKLFANMFFNTVPVTGHDRMYADEVATPVANTYTVLHFTTPGFVDLGVESAVSGKSLDWVAAAPVAGQYTVDNTTGAYTFAAGDADAVKVKITYIAHEVTGSQVPLDNQLLGIAPIFKLFLSQSRNVKNMMLVLNACISTKLTMQTKLDDYTIPEFGFGAFVDDANSLGTYNFSED